MTKAWTATSPARLVVAGVGLTLTLAACSTGGLALGSSNQADAATSSGSVAASSTGTAAESAGSTPTDSTPPTPSSVSQSAAAGAVAPVPNAAGVVDGAAFTAWVTAAARRAGGAHMVMSRKGAQGTMSAVGDIVLGATVVEQDVTAKVGTQSMHMLLLPDGLYMSMSTVRLPVGKKWVLISATGTDQVSTALRPMFQALQSDSMSTVTPESKRGLAVKRVGATTFVGVPVVRYVYSSTQAQIAAALKLVPAANRAQAKAALAGMKSSVSMLVDADGLPRQVITTTTLKGKKTTSTITYSGWGRRATITAPPAAEVADAASLS